MREIWSVDPDGSDAQIITEGVQICYDAIVGSMDWGSGFLDTEEMLAILRLGATMGWGMPDLDGGNRHHLEHHLELANQFPEHYEITEVPYYNNPQSPNYFNADGSVRMRGQITKKERS